MVRPDDSTDVPKRMSPKAGQIDRTDTALLVFLSLMWGGGFVLAGIALKELPPVTVVFGRVAFGASPGLRGRIRLAARHSRLVSQDFIRGFPDARRTDNA